MEEAAKLLELKQLDADWAVIFGPKTVKVRWQFTEADGQDVRLQFQFANRTSVSVAEVKKVRSYDTLTPELSANKAIIYGMAGKYTAGALKKLEFKTDKKVAGVLQWREINNDVWPPLCAIRKRLTSSPTQEWS